jgi:hypothetical protein
MILQIRYADKKIKMVCEGKTFAHCPMRICIPVFSKELCRVQRPQTRRRNDNTIFLDGVFCILFWFPPDFVTPHIQYADMQIIFE